MRPLRAGDYSFNQIGPTGLYMLLSNIPIEERKRRGYYAVGGCGGNIAWHTPGRPDAGGRPRDPAPRSDGLPDDDRPHPERAAAPVRLRARRSTRCAPRSRAIRRPPAGEVDFAPLLDDLDGARPTACAAWRARGRGARRQAPARRASGAGLNGVLRRIARLLVPLNYARGERFDHDPALKFGAVPRLEAAAGLAAAPAELRPFIKVGLVRELNKVRATVRALRRELA